MTGVASVTARISEITGYIDALAQGPAVGVLGLDLAATGATTARNVGGMQSTADAFASTLSQVDGTTRTDVGGGLSAVDSHGVPTELKRYGNGTIPASALTEISGSHHKLWEPAATSFEALRAAAKADGVEIGITDSYRTYDTQVDLVRRKGLYTEGGLAAKPGTSNHGWGTALDLRLDGEALSWMRTNAGDFGFVEDTPRESWHWGYHPTH
ncbi:D-alanyl-D-alanine carboxypeptidase family protein [Sanguibacter sp. HDW7]|uniref:M15 family metallopeptidase n=1 Tax=Sanguibacter sp. HDW7 TaxID=2714931 RepID=UPI00140E3C92|nr:M15 family metallopeptidase [Sanguibacter sp. HDW7]QIK84652.1 peptidase M15 [Sanguibacter sp. HDW7]